MITSQIYKDFTKTHVLNHNNRFKYFLKHSFNAISIVLNIQAETMQMYDF